MQKPYKALEPVKTANKMIETAKEKKTNNMKNWTGSEKIKKSKVFNSSMIGLEFMNENQIKRSKSILDLINQSETVERCSSR